MVEFQNLTVICRTPTKGQGENIHCLRIYHRDFLETGDKNNIAEKLNHLSTVKIAKNVLEIPEKKNVCGK